MPSTVPLLLWQKCYIEDDSRFKFVAASVQSGKSFGTSLEMSLDRLQPGSKSANLGILLSASERQSVELIEKVKMHTRAWDVRFEDGYFGQTEIAEHRVIFPNGKRLIGLPANPDTARGYSGDVFLDEFALHRDSRAIWAAMMTRATRGFKVRVASTFKGTENKFYELAKLLGLHTGAAPDLQPVKANGWSGHWVDVHMAKAQGMPVDVDGLRAAIGDEEIWLQDYCNVPMSGAESFIPLELVLACESGEASVDWDGKPRPGLCAGLDIGRKRDLSHITLVEPVADLVIVRGLIWMPQMKFADQMKIASEVAAAIEQGGGQFAVDATGLGMQLAEELHDKYTCVQPVQFGGSVDSGEKSKEGKPVMEPVKTRLAMTLKRRMEDHQLRLPESAKLRRACQAIKRMPTPTGFTFDAARTAQGHADEFWSLALAVGAAVGASGYQPMLTHSAIGGSTVLGNLMTREF